jgi:glycosyltransferase involved in cell wall biosynthesis
MPQVSVIIPVFNAAATVGCAVESVLAQTLADLEIIAVDDGSTDASLGALARFGERVKVMRQDNRGPSAARNLGVRNSSGEYLAFLDADDWWMPVMLERLVAALKADRTCVVAYCDLKLVDSLGRELGTSLAGAPCMGAPTVEDMLGQLWPIMPSGVVMRRGALEAVGGFPEQLRAFEDVYLWLVMREQGRFAFVPDKLAAWRFALFPSALKPGGGQEHAGKIFRRMVRERYGVDPLEHVRSRRRAPRSILGYIGLAALARDDRRTARRAFVCALRLDPLRFKNYMRLLRTFLPRQLARSLGGRTTKAPGRETTPPAAL